MKAKISSLQAELKELQKQHEKQRSELESFVAAREKSKSCFFFCSAQSTSFAEFAQILGSFKTRQRPAGVTTCITK